MKVISFKIDDAIYDALKKKNKTFRALFEPIALQLSQNNSREKKYTPSIPKNFHNLYKDIQLVLKKYENEDEKTGVKKLPRQKLNFFIRGINE
jgi:hypothetical protein